ncbi:MAG: hypothetical protein ABSF84_04585 [Acidimicrobiales bacterium]
MRRLSHKRAQRGVEAQGRQLVEECESFLTGRYPRLLLSQGDPVPNWAWLSALAHAPAGELDAGIREEMAAPGGDHMTATWEGALELLVGELFMTAERAGTTVDRLQRALIAEVELKGPWAESGAVLGPSRCVQDVRRVLCRFGDPSRHR